MIKIHKFTFFFLFIILSFAGFSQNQIAYENSQKDSCLFKFNEEPKENEVIANYIIQELSKSIPKILSYTEYVFSFSQNSKIIKLSPKNYEVSIIIENKNCKGDIFYKGFIISDILIPSNIDFTVNILNEDNSTNQKFNFEKVKLDSETYKIACFKFEDSLSDAKYKLTVNNKSFYYDDSVRIAFDKKMKFVDDYYLSDMLLEQGFKKLQMINTKNVDMLPLYGIQLKDIEEIIEKLNKKDYPNQLNIKKHDPIDFVKRLSNLTEETHKSRTIVNQLLATLDYVYFRKGLEYNVDNNIQMAIVYFEKSTKVNQYYTPSYFQLAKIYFNQDEINKAASIVTDVLLNMKPDFSTNKNLLVLADSIYSTFISKGEELNKEEKYNEAIELLLTGKEFCSKTPGIVCDDEIQKAIARGKYGLFYSYIKVAKRAIASDKLDLAKTYIEYAQTYQQKNKDDIISDSEVNSMLVKLSDAYSNLGQSENSSHNFKEALKYFEAASRLCNSSPNIDCSDDLKQGILTAKQGIYDNYILKAIELYQCNDAYNAEKNLNDAKEFQKANSETIISTIGTDTITGKVKFKIYKNLISYAEQLIGYRQFEYALDKLNEARKLEEDFVFDKNERIDSLLTVAAKPVILDNIKIGKLKAWGSEIDKANNIYKKAIEFQENYNLSNDEEINNAVADLKNKMLDRDCYNAQIECDNNYRKAIRNASMKDYITTQFYLDKALKIAEEKTSCTIIATSAEILTKKYLPAVIYQKLLLESENSLNNKNYGDAILYFRKAEKYYSEKNIKSFQIKEQSLLFFTLSKSDKNFLAYCSDYFIENKELENAFTLLKTLKRRNYPINDSRNLQEKLAQELAQADKKENPSGNPKSNVLKYTGGDKWYKYFKKAYLVAWKKGC